MGGILEMLRSPLDFRALQSDSRSRVHPLLVVRFRRNELNRTRYGISTGRRLGPAVVRNRVRRRLRTILRSLNGRVARGWDVLLVARPSAAGASQAELGGALENLLKSSGLMEGTGSAK
jgi:ribonuclease P protein component